MVLNRVKNRTRNYSEERERRSETWFALAVENAFQVSWSRKSEFI
jgi:hypothetical protein